MSEIELIGEIKFHTMIIRDVFLKEMKSKKYLFKSKGDHHTIRNECEIYRVIEE